MKQKELLTRQRDLAAKLQHHFTVSQMRFENLQQKLEPTTAQDENLLKQKHYVSGKQATIKPHPQQPECSWAPVKKTKKAGRSQRHHEGMTFYTAGSRTPQKVPPLFSF
ncbi:uncharacterized protein LOC143269287 [Peromyscus maniculatus bairdii]|uniref:uncharacterized protein LOC143269287 n=1 Tax=Peromyscus maniculatus bairdii TaxID=230844 RepID=UPI003FD57E64